MEESLPHPSSVAFGSFFSPCPFLWFKDTNRTNFPLSSFLVFFLSNPLLSITLGRVELQERDGVWCLEANVCILIV